MTRETPGRMSDRLSSRDHAAPPYRRGHARPVGPGFGSSRDRCVMETVAGVSALRKSAGSARRVPGCRRHAVVDCVVIGAMLPRNGSSRFRRE